MKKTSLLIALLIFMGFGLAKAQQTQVSDLAGEYVCSSVGIPASLEFAVQGSQIELTFCPDIANDCNSYIEVYPTLVDGMIMQKGQEAGDPPRNWEDIRFVVEQNQGQVTIRASYADGIEYVFDRL